jgi:endonuclease/exonuclease/phosphatase (EEP) superfamily protein YafD
VVVRRALSLLIAAGALAGLVLGALGLWYAPLDIFAQFAGQWLILAVLALIAAAVPHRAGAIMSAAIVMVTVAAPLISALYRGEAAGPGVVRTVDVAAASTLRSPTSDGATSTAALAPAFKLLTFNLLNDNRDTVAIIAEIARQDADVVFLAEFGPAKKALQRWMAERYPYRVECAAKCSCAIGLYARFPIHGRTIIGARDDAGPRRIHADIEVAGNLVHVIGTHLISPLLGPSANFREMDFLARVIANRPAGPVVVAGDFNATLFSNAFRNFERTSGLAHMGHLIPSWPMSPVAMPQIGIDHVFLSPDLELYDVAAGRAAGSDHLPIAATLRFRN